MKNLTDYVNNLNFDYAISYSGLRGEKFKALEQENKNKIKRLETEIESARFMQKPKLKAKIAALESELDIYNSRVINREKELHKSTIPVHRFRSNDRDIHDIFEMLKTPYQEHHAWMCPPIFRDAIVFYSKEDEVKGILQICFGCQWIKNEKEEDFNVDHTIYPKLKEKLVRLGHQIGMD